MYQKLSTFLYIWRSPLFLILAFLMGALTGVFAESAFLITELKAAMGRGPEMVNALIQHRLTSRLGLDAEQQAELKPILDDATNKMKAIRSDSATNSVSNRGFCQPHRKDIATGPSDTTS